MVNLNNIMKFDDFVKEENEKVGKEPVKLVKEHNDAIKDYCVKLREDYTRSYIDEHERDVEPEEEE